MLYTLERDVPTVEALAQRALAGAVKRELPLWISVARSFLGWSEVESGRLAEGIDTLEKQRDFLQTAHLVYWLPTYLCWLAEAYVRADKLVEARLWLEQARDVFGRAVTTGTRLSAFVSKGGFPRTLKSMMRRSLNGTSSKRLRSPASVANADLPCARRTVLRGFSLPKARPNVHTHCCNTN
jgi:hypothetical protein